MTPTATLVFDTIRKHFGTSSTLALARLMMSMHNGDTAFNFFRDAGILDDRNTRLALEIITEYFNGTYRDGDFTPLANFIASDKGTFSEKEYRKWCLSSHCEIDP